MKVAASQAGADLRFVWVGGRLALDFTNSTAWSRSLGPGGEEEQPEYERFTRYGRLVEWAQAAEALSEREAASLLAEAERRPEDASLALQQTLALRQAIHRIFVNTAHEQPVDPAALAVLNATLSEGMARLRLMREDETFALRWTGGESALTRPLWPVAQDAADLLVSGDLSRVRECSGDICGFLFVDRSRPGKRRWCDMRDCGNRAKVRRHYERVRALNP